MLRDLRPGQNLYLLATGTGLAPFISLIQDRETYERFEKVILIHGVRWQKDLAYRDFISEELPQHEYFADLVRDKWIYYPTVTREPFCHQGRITQLVNSGRLFADIGLPPFDPARDRAMVCGSLALNIDLKAILEGFGLREGANSAPLEFVVEKAFVGEGI